MNKVFLLIVVTALVLPVGNADAQLLGRRKKSAPVESSETKEMSYDKLFKGKKNIVTAESDFITLHIVDGKLYFEIPHEYFGREMLMASVPTETSSPDYGNVGYKAKAPLHIMFTLRDSVVQMRSVNTGMNGKSIEDALNRVQTDPILYSYGVKAHTPDSSAVVVDMTPLFTTHVKAFDFFPEGILQTLLKFTPTFKKENSYLEDVKAFDDNLSVKSVMSYTISMGFMGIKILDDQPFTAKVTRSIMLLPEDKMKPRISDSRVGVFNTGMTRFSPEKEDRAHKYSVAHRWRVEPSDVEAYMRGETVEPKKQIVFYVDNAFPDKWKGAVKKGIEDWNAAFEAIGFRNVVKAVDFPVDDPDFDPDNLKYSCIRYLPSTTANAMGPSWVDPTTGEIINASVIVYSNISDLINQWRFVQTAQVDPSVRTKRMPDDIMLGTMRYVIAHEIGHCLGFMHNMAASAAYPVDSLRSATFTRQYGTTPCIMDYARFNYIAQPGDEGVKLTPPVLGVYDYFLVGWNYRYLPQFADEWEEKATVESWVDQKAGDPVYRYGRQQIRSRYDPSAIEEDLGDDPIKASTYGVKNLKYILDNLEAWIDDDVDYIHRQKLYTELLNQYYRYIRNVSLNIGGIYLTDVKEGTTGRRNVPVDKATQKASLKWILDEYLTMDWVDDHTMKDNFNLQVTGAPMLRAKINKDIKGLIGNVILSSYYSDSPYTIQDFTKDLYDATWRSLLVGRPLTEGDKALQRAMVDMFIEPLKNKESGSQSILGFAPSVDEIIAYDLDPTGVVKLFAHQLTRYEEKYGRGSVAELLDQNRFGTPGLGFQSKVDVSAIDDSSNYLIDLAVRSRNLLLSRINSTSGSDKAHYQSLLIKLNAVLKDKLM